MRFSGHGEADGINVSNQRLPMRDRLNIVLLSDVARAGVIDIADAPELRTTFTGERCMNARMLLSQVSDADDCGFQAHPTSKCLAAGVARPINPYRDSNGK